MEVKLVNTSCPVEIGDRFYREKPNQTIPDMLEVMESWKNGTHWLIRAKYIYHTIGPTFERTFSDIIFQDPSWIIVKKGTDGYERYT